MAELIFHPCLRKSECEASSRLKRTGTDWAVAPSHQLISLIIIIIIIIIIIMSDRWK